ncbi:MAG TPA: gamma-glutamylcyclotransferase family protein [Thermoleophilaceae bacterium]|nr:gamma-glutamylcyclotransferase family protein [Thermoleophilaceae bacterium]
MLLFSYGSNLASEEVSEGARFLGPALLRDHRLALTRRSIRWGGGVVDVVEAAGECVWGAVYEAPETALVELDRKEGAGFAYRRRAVEVSVEGELRSAVAYEVIHKEPDAPPATPEYAALVLRGARERGLPEAWLGELESVLTGAGSVPAG